MPADEPPSTFPTELSAALDKYRAWEKDYLDREQAENIPTAPLYHYTDARGLQGIFDSKQIWYTDYRHLNDPSEILHGLTFARNIARQWRETAHPDAHFFLDQFIERLQRAPFDDLLEYYLASFSRVRNDLGQWRAYADNGRGFAVGFAPRLFEVVEQPPIDKPAEFIGAVNYPEDPTALYSPPITLATEIFLSEARNAHLMQHEVVKFSFVKELTITLVGTLIWRSLTTKHPAYKHEEEVRQFIPQRPELSGPLVKTRLRGSEMVPYIPQPWPVREPGNVVEIVIGPAAPRDAERTLRKFLSSLGMAINEISRSDIPYRVL